LSMGKSLGLDIIVKTTIVRQVFYPWIWLVRWGKW
jgi:hypothetical protein